MHAAAASHCPAHSVLADCGDAPPGMFSSGARSILVGNQAHLPHAAHRLGPIARPQLGEQLADVIAHAIRASDPARRRSPCPSPPQADAAPPSHAHSAPVAGGRRPSPSPPRAIAPPPCMKNRGPIRGMRPRAARSPRAPAPAAMRRPSRRTSAGTPPDVRPQRPPRLRGAPVAGTPFPGVAAGCRDRAAWRGGRRRTTRTALQSSPSNKAENYAGDSPVTPFDGRGHWKPPPSRRLYTITRPVRSQTGRFNLSSRLERKANTAPL